MRQPWSDKSNFADLNFPPHRSGNSMVGDRVPVLAQPGLLRGRRLHTLVVDTKEQTTDDAVGAWAAAGDQRKKRQRPRRKRRVRRRRRGSVGRGRRGGKGTPPAGGCGGRGRGRRLRWRRRRGRAGMPTAKGPEGPGFFLWPPAAPHAPTASSVVCSVVSATRVCRRRPRKRPG
jgi:hypothetical protein